MTAVEEFCVVLQIGKLLGEFSVPYRARADVCYSVKPD
jgi:hypothetical protein